MNATGHNDQSIQPSGATSPPGSRRRAALPATPPTRGAVELGLLVPRVVAGVLLFIHGLQGLLAPAGRIATTAALGVPLAPIAGWLSILGEAGLGILLVAGLATRVAGALAAILMTATWIATAAARGVITDQPGITAENALLISAIGLAVAVLGGGRYTLANALRLPRLVQ